MVYIFLANGFEEIEAITVVDVLRRAKIEVKTVGVNDNFLLGAHGVKVEADLLKEDIDLKDLECIVLPGGMPGTINLANDNKVLETIKYCVDNNKLIAAICAAPSILGKLGILNGKEAICYPGFEDKLLGAKISDKSICLSDNILTAKGPGIALDFSLKIVEILKSKEFKDSIEDDLQIT